MKGPDTQETLSLGWAGGAKGTTGLTKASPHQVRQQNCQGGWPYLLKPSSLTCYPTKRNLLLEGKDRLSQDISGSVWPVPSILRPLMAQVLLRDPDPAYTSTVSFGKWRAPLPSSDSCHSGASQTRAVFFCILLSQSLVTLGRQALATLLTFKTKAVF